MVSRRCFYCLEETVSLSFTRYSQPYLTCASCRAKTFIKHVSAIKGLANVPYAIDRMVFECSKDPLFLSFFEQRTLELERELSQGAAQRVAMIDRAAAADASPIAVVKSLLDLEKKVAS